MLQPDKQSRPERRLEATDDCWAAVNHRVAESPPLWAVWQAADCAGERPTRPWSRLLRGGGAVRPHGRLCTPACVDARVPTTLDRERPPLAPCPWCEAPAGVACFVRGKARLQLTAFGRLHPSRLEAA